MSTIVESCPLCKGVKHQRVLEGEGTPQARWVYKACICVVKERWRVHLGVFATASRIATTPLLKFVARNLFCCRASLGDLKTHMGHYLRCQPLAYRYRILDVRGMGALYVSETGEEDQTVYREEDLVVILLNLTAIKSAKADDLLCRAIQSRVLAGKPLWIVYGGVWSEFQKEFEKASGLVKDWEQVSLIKGGQEISGNASALAGGASLKPYGL